MKIKVWDISTRLFHWLLVITYIGAFFTSRNEWFLEHHVAIGYIAIGLVFFRIGWGFAGNRYARFVEFLKGWKDVKAYLLKAASLNPPRHLGHNPAVGWVIVVMLLVTALITATGIITYGGEENRGAWAVFFTFETAVYARALHIILAYVAVAMIVIHVCAALFHDFALKENIILSMITGKKEDHESWKERVSRMRPEEGRSVARLALWIVLAVLGGIGLVYLPPEGRSDFTGKETVTIVNDKGFITELAPNGTWKAECATSCHGVFHPTLLPADSWKRLMAGLGDHFGENVSLDEKAQKEILGYLVASSAEHSTTEASRKISRSIKKGDSPITITETPYLKRKHAEVSKDVFKRQSIVSKSNCIACHPGANVGSFEDKDINIPK